MKVLFKVSEYSRVIEKFLFFPKRLAGEWHWLQRKKITQSLGSWPMGGGEECYIRKVWIDCEYYYKIENK